MIDLLIYCNTKEYDSIQCLAKTPKLEKNGMCVFLARVEDDHKIPKELIIGYDDESEEYKFEPYGKEKYESIYSVEPYEVDGVLTTPPKKIGVFA